MNDQHVKKMIREAEKQTGTSSYKGARLMAMLTVAPTPFIFLGGLPIIVVVLSGVCGLITASLWSDGLKFKRDLTKRRARTLWQQINENSAFGDNPSSQERELLKGIGRIYDRDPQGETLPLPQAIRLTLVWKQQQQRLQTIESHITEMQFARTTLQEKQNLLRELNDENSGLDRALARLDDDITPLGRSHNALRASCTRLEALIVEIDSTIRRRELHREADNITARLPSGNSTTTSSLEVSDEHLELERQIGREIETYLQLERETDAHLRDL
jgi:DNA repair exonuclease SbcCD ATPase subunit